MVMRTQSCATRTRFAPSLRSSIRACTRRLTVKTLRFAMRWYRSEPERLSGGAAGTRAEHWHHQVPQCFLRPPLTARVLLPVGKVDNEARCASSLDDQALARLIKSGAVTAQTELAGEPEPQVEWCALSVTRTTFPSELRRSGSARRALSTGRLAASNAGERRGCGDCCVRWSIKRRLRSVWRAWVIGLTPCDEA